MPPRKATPTPASVAKSATAVSTAPTLEVLQQEVAGCSRCHELATTRTQTVFGVGDPAARLCFLGEAPGADEDRQGEPFVGRGGAAAQQDHRGVPPAAGGCLHPQCAEVPPARQSQPATDEAANCRGFLNRQLELIDPEFICCLGAVAAQNLLQTQTAIGKLRGQVHEYRGIKVVCTYHPAYLLRNPPAKKDAWEDMQMLMKLMGIKV